MQKAVTELKEDRSNSRDVPNDAVICSYLAPATWAQEFGALAAVLTQTFPHLAAVEVNHVSEKVGKE